MIRTHSLPCHLPHALADAFNRESGRIYSRVLVNHYRVYRHSDHWLSRSAAEKLDDLASKDEPRLEPFGPPLGLHAHSIDAAQQAFYQACKTAKVNRADGAHYPHRRPHFRPTIWKNSAIRRRDSTLLLGLARGQEPIRVPLSDTFPSGSVVEARLVYDRVGRGYEWHLVVDDGREPPDPPGPNAAAFDLGEVHPIAATDGEQAVVFSARELRAVKQGGHKRRAELQRLQSQKSKGSRQWKKLQLRKTRFAAKQKRRIRDIEHKVSRAAVDWAVERDVGTLAIGDVRDVADGVDKGAPTNQKIAGWSHGKLRRYITYKAEATGIAVELVDEAHTTQTCPNCGERHKPRGRRYRCPACGFFSHRDTVGAANILSRYRHHALGKVRPPAETKYRHPCNRRVRRSRPDTGQALANSVRKEAKPVACGGLYV